MKIRLGTRKSALALAQSEEVKAKLLAAWPHLEVELVKITTSGDKFTEFPLADIGGKGLFTKEIEEALLNRSIDIAVHSMKDMPTVLPDGLTIGAMLKREDPRDVLIGRQCLSDIPKGATFGTASLRRAAQILMKRPDLSIVTLRGNVETRLSKVQKGLIGATMLAQAGLNRLGIKGAGAALSTDEFLPAIAQGAVGIECRMGDQRINDLLAVITNETTVRAVDCERAFLKVLDGSCRTPIAGYAHLNGDEIQFRGLIAKPDGSAHHTVTLEDRAINFRELGEEAGRLLLAKAGKHFI
ncbi:MAG: hydroxymethylbilane synthase [Rickettsiales bacterium]|nr:hydroxymethylbilane synthase [Rickettsiales bacterium]